MFHQVTQPRQDQFTALTPCTGCLEEKLTDEGYGRGEAGSDVSSQAVLHSEPQVLKLPLVEVGARGGDVEHSCDARCCEGLSAGGVDGTAQKQEGQQLHWTILQLTKSRQSPYLESRIITMQLWFYATHVSLLVSSYKSEFYLTWSYAGVLRPVATGSGSTVETRLLADL